MTPTSTITIIENKGLAIVICGIVIYLLYKYFTNVMIKTNQTNIEILETLNNINNFLINGYCRDNDFDLLVKLRGRYAILEYKWVVIKYILHNHIKENLQTIKLELANYINSSNNRSLELFQNRACPQDIAKNVELIETSLNIITNNIIPIFEKVDYTSLSNIADKIEMIRTIENIFSKTENEFLKK